VGEAQHADPERRDALENDPRLIIVGESSMVNAELGRAAECGGAPSSPGVHKHRNLLANAPERLHDEITVDYKPTDLHRHAAGRPEAAQSLPAQVAATTSAVANGLEEAGDRLFTFTALPPSEWKSARTTNAIERLPQEFFRRNIARCQNVLVRVTVWRALRSQRESHLRINLYRIGAQRRERHTEQTNSFAHGKLSRQQLVAD
jgi:transposase-like protein